MRRCGLTLIEVLVALAIVAVTLAAGIKAAGALTDNARRLQDVTVAQWCADNQLTALRLGRLLGARTIWLDSIANVDELSLSGLKARRHADLWLTQWPHLARPEGPFYMGAVM